MFSNQNVSFDVDASGLRAVALHLLGHLPESNPNAICLWISRLAALYQKPEAEDCVARFEVLQGLHWSLKHVRTPSIRSDYFLGSHIQFMPIIAIIVSFHDVTDDKVYCVLGCNDPSILSRLPIQDSELNRSLTRIPCWKALMEIHYSQV